MKVYLIIITTLLFASNISVIAQSSDSTELANLSAELDELFANEADSLSLFFLIDSLIAVSSSQNGLSVRLGYSSRVTTAGRDFGVDQQGLSPGISYYHKSGVYGDITGVWNSELDPKYYLTVATIGYLGSFKKNWAYSASYDHSFYHATDSTDIFPLTNAVSTSVSYDFKHLYSGLNYSYAFGDEIAHQLAWNLTGVIKKKAFKPFNSITFLPTFSILWGNQTLTYSSSVINTQSFIQNLTNAEILAYFQKQEGDIGRMEVRRLSTSIIDIKNDLNNGQVLDRKQDFIITRFSNGLQTEVDSFGLLNYYISLPISFNMKKLSVLLSYNYNIPKELPESVLDQTESNGYFGFTLSYNIGL